MCVCVCVCARTPAIVSVFHSHIHFLFHGKESILSILINYLIIEYNK